MAEKSIQLRESNSLASSSEMEGGSLSMLPSDPAQMRMQAAANQSQQVQQLKSLQEGANQGAPPAQLQSGPVVQRQVDFDATSNQLNKIGRFDFEHDLKTAMPVAHGQHRCHTISYGFIATGVKDPINQAIAGANPAWVDQMLEGMIKSIFPNGAASGVHGGGLNVIAAKYHGIAMAAKVTIMGILGTAPLNGVALAAAANELISALNNSPDNLRPGLGATNSSIQEALDFTQSGTQVLPIGTQVTNDGSTFITLTAPQTIITIDGTQQAQVHTLLTETYGQAQEVHVFSSGTQVQSSDHATAMNSGNMSNANPTPIGMPWGAGYRLFEV